MAKQKPIFYRESWEDWIERKMCEEGPFFYMAAGLISLVAYLVLVLVMAL